MNIKKFLSVFQFYWPGNEAAMPSVVLEDQFIRSYFDPCFDVTGMSSIKKLRLLNLAFGCLEENESYLEIGTYVGKSLIGAMRNNLPRTVYACDNFSEFAERGSSLDVLQNNLVRYGLWEKVKFFDGDFRKFINRENISVPAGLYLNDGAHDEISQYDGIRVAEDVLADETLVLVDDWRFADDSQSYAKAGTLRAIAESKHRWTQLLELPARYNGDHAMWWNGIGVFAFQRNM